MNAMDMLLLVTLLGFTVLGYVRGFFRQMVTLTTVYLAAVLATQYHVLVGSWLSYFFWGDPTPRAAVAFIIVFIWGTLFLGWTVRHIYPTMNFGKLGLVDNVCGAGLGACTGLVFACLTSVLLSFALSVTWPDSDWLRVSLGGSLRSSVLVPVVMAYTPAIQQSITLWFPNGTPSLFALVS
ncbi:MAG: CvpA family protein [Chloroflexota bacterium]